MWSMGWRAVVVGSVLVALGGCASSEEWKTWKEHPTHYASGDHGFFSLRNNRDGSSAKVTRDDIAMARDQGWWGKPITVSQEQILER